MKIAIIQFPGSNCEAESLRAVRNAGMDTEEFLWNGNYSKLSAFDGYFIIGGFSYEDRSRAGAIAALDPVMKIISEESKKGKPVLGICNGAQILVETGLVPGLANNTVGMALATNRRVKNGAVVGTGYYNVWVHIKLAAPSIQSAFTRHLKPGQILSVPIAHGEGQFMMEDALLKELIDRNLTTFRYCNDYGDVIPDFPINPNGALYNLAAVANNAGNVLAMMPHPERSSDGILLFTSMREYISSEKKIDLSPLPYIPPAYDLKPYQPTENSFPITIDLIITDNEASTVQNTLTSLNIPAKIKRSTHWEIQVAPGANKEEVKQKIIASGELHNSNKERPTTATIQKNTTSFLVQYREEVFGRQKCESLKKRFDLHEITDIKKSTLWHITTPPSQQQATTDAIIKSHILFNQFSQDCFIYQGESSRGYTEKISAAVGNCIENTNFSFGHKRQGKVRDTYELPDKLILVTTDRQSAFDRVLAAIPFKGQVLNMISAWWFEHTKHIVSNHILSIPDPNVTIAKKCTVFPVEFVVRGYITGTTSTSAWMNYEKGVRDYCGNRLPEGLKKNQKFEKPLLTPTTKSDTHDRLISPQEIMAEGLMTQADWEYVGQKALEIFAYGQEVATKHGLILVDTKYEFGRDADGIIRIVDELHTPDSSRYWIANSYADRFAAGKEPENIDKEFLRLWFKDHCDPYNDTVLPPAPKELVIELSRRYIMLYEMITGEKFQFPDAHMPITERIQKNILKLL